jgi:Mrp family chromosome partitioning ATPase
MTHPKRKYVRLAPSKWAEICALWEIGDVTLPDLAERYRVSTRTLQAHFAKHKVEKGSKAAALATSVKAEIHASGLDDKNHTVERARATREAAYSNATLLEGRIMQAVAAMSSSKTVGQSSTLKSLALAAAGLERLHGLKLRALGLDKDIPLQDELPVLTFRDLSEEEIKARRDRDEDDEAEPFAPETPKLAVEDEGEEPDLDEEDDIMTEGAEEPELKDKVVLRDADGCRLVRGALP